MNIPQLRFKEFTDEWQEKRLVDIAKKCFVKNGNLEKLKVLTNSAVRGIVIQTDYFDKDIANSSNTNGYYVVNNDDFVYNPRISSTAPVGPIKRNHLSAGLMSPLYMIFRFFNGNIDFFEQYFETTYWHHYLTNIANIGARHDRMNILDSDFFRMPVPYPSLFEQQKIASFLTVVDEKIEKIEQKKKGFEKYKKGVMQAIFSQKIRFKKENGDEYPDWEEKKLGETGNIVTGTTPSTANQEYYDGIYPWVTPTDIGNEKDIYTSAKLLTDQGMKVGRFVPKNSLLVTCIASIGKNAILRNDGSCNQQINAIISNKKNEVNFLYYLLEKHKNLLIRFAGAGGMQILNKNDFSNIKFILPSLEEQEKIAEFLTSLDNKVDLINKELDQAKLFKKSLLQQMFV